MRSSSREGVGNGTRGGQAHVKIIASLRINNGLKCQRGTSSICFSAANPTATATTTKHLLPPIAPPLPLASHYICMSVLKINPKLNWSERNNAMALKEPSSRFSNKFAECLSASESETNLWHVFQFLCPLLRPLFSSLPPTVGKPASSRVNLPKVSASLCPQSTSHSLPRSLPFHKEAETADSNCKRKMCHRLPPWHHYPLSTPVPPSATLLHFNSVFLLFLSRLLQRGRLFKRILNAASKKKSQTKLAKKYWREKQKLRECVRERERWREGERYLCELLRRCIHRMICECAYKLSKSGWKNWRKEYNK